MFKRLIRVLKGWFNGLLGKAENPKLLMGELITEMQQQKMAAQKLVAAHVAQERMAERKLQHFENEALNWEEKAMTAVKHGRDDLAMEALRRKETAQATADEYRKQFMSANSASLQLKNQLRLLDERIEEAKSKKDIILAKQARAEAQQKIQETLNSFNPDTSAFEAFERMEEKVEAMQANADAHAELSDEFSDNVLENQFRDLENEAGATNALASLKSRMGLLTEEPQSEDDHFEMDEELAALEREFATASAR